MRELGHKVVLTSGTFDIIHIGHAQYIQVASLYGDFLVVGVDSDEKVRAKKGPTRPIVPQGTVTYAYSFTGSWLSNFEGY